MKLRAIFFSILTLFVGFLSTQTFAEGHSDAEPMQVTVGILPQKYFLNEYLRDKHFSNEYGLNILLTLLIELY